MSNNLIEDRAFVNSIVGEGTRFNGELDLNGLLRIDGDFTGTIKTTGKVLVGKNGRAECTINASTVVVGGAVKGNIYSSERVIVLSSGMILGNIYTPRLIVEEGVILDGECVIDEDYTRDVKGIKSEDRKDTADEAVKEEDAGSSSAAEAENTASAESEEASSEISVNQNNNSFDTSPPSDSTSDKQSVGYYNN